MIKETIEKYFKNKNNDSCYISKKRGFEKHLNYILGFINKVTNFKKNKNRKLSRNELDKIKNEIYSSVYIYNK